MGPFTYQNQKSNSRFATGFTHGDYCIIEYYEPKASQGAGRIAIDGIVHGYRSIRSEVNSTLRAFQDSGACNNDVECAIGNGWEDQIKSVGLILTANNSRFCTGALINNTGDDCQSYFLSANHCFANDNPGDVLNDIFMFNYDSPSPACPGTPNTDGPTKIWRTQMPRAADKPHNRVIFLLFYALLIIVAFTVPWDFGDFVKVVAILVISTYINSLANESCLLYTSPSPRDS